MTRDESLPEFDARPSIRLTNTMPEHPKIAGLTDAAFRLWVEALCYCSRQETNGKITTAVMKKLGAPRAIRTLIEAGLVELVGDGYEVHDYLKHQRSSEEISAFRESRSEDGKLGAHLRWHVPRRQKSKDCDYCLKGVQSA